MKKNDKGDKLNNKLTKNVKDDIASSEKINEDYSDEFNEELDRDYDNGLEEETNEDYDSRLDEDYDEELGEEFDEEEFEEESIEESTEESVVKPAKKPKKQARVRPSSPTPPRTPQQIAADQRVNKTRFLLAAAVCLFSLVVLIFLFSPFFHINEVHIFGNFRITDEEIGTRLNAQDGSHLLLFNTRRAAERVMENRYISAVEFDRIMPGRLHVYVTERRLTAFVEHMPGSFLYLDDSGRVLEIRSYTNEPLPVLVGLQFTRFQLGEIIEVPDPAAFGTVVLYTQLLSSHGLIDQVTRMSVGDTSNIRITMHNIEFNVGGGTNADEKVRTMAAILDAMPNLGIVPGFVDLRDLSRGWFPFGILQ